MPPLLPTPIRGKGGGLVIIHGPPPWIMQTTNTAAALRAGSDAITQNYAHAMAMELFLHLTKSHTCGLPVPGIRLGLGHV